MKRKILFTTEYTNAKSGFGKIGRELLTRFAQIPDFDIAEASAFATIEHDFSHAKWRVYPLTVGPNHPEFQIFESHPNNNWGAWRMDRVLLEYQPDIVINWGDPWNYQFMDNSPFREFFHLCVCPTCDSTPQQVQWLQTLQDCDSMFTYADWCIPYMQKHGLNPLGALYPGVDTKIFKPKDKIVARNKVGLPEDILLIGTTMRNQPRKLFAELFKAFGIFLKKYGHTEIGKKTYLYLHTSYPDAGWDLPGLLNEYGVTNRVYFSYICQYSRKPLALKFSETAAFSPYSNTKSAGIPNVGHGYSEEQLVDMYNMFDLYIQYAVCEGLGLGGLEASSCGVPVCAIDYSAMSDVVQKTGGIALKPASIPRDLMMKADRATPDNEATADAFYKFLCLNKSYRQKKSEQARKGAVENFDWDISAAKLSNHIRNIKLTGLQGKWNAPPRPIDQSFPDVPQNITNTQFVQWCCTFIAKQPELASKYTGIQWISWLNNGGFLEGGKFNKMTREEIYNMCRHLGQNKIFAERARCGVDQLQMTDYIEFSNVLYDDLKGQNA